MKMYVLLSNLANKGMMYTRLDESVRLLDDQLFLAKNTTMHIRHTPDLVQCDFLFFPKLLIHLNCKS